MFRLPILVISLPLLLLLGACPPASTDDTGTGTTGTGTTGTGTTGTGTTGTGTTGTGTTGTGTGPEFGRVDCKPAVVTVEWCDGLRLFECLVQVAGQDICIIKDFAPTGECELVYEQPSQTESDNDIAAAIVEKCSQGAEFGKCGNIAVEGYIGLCEPEAPPPPPLP